MDGKKEGRRKRDEERDERRQTEDEKKELARYLWTKVRRRNKSEVTKKSEEKK